MFTGQCLDNENIHMLVCSHNGILFSNKNGEFINVTTWMDPENMLSERSQAQEDHVLYESIT
jgi:hypothetical protein